jgi:hypothetical protein
VLFVHDVHAVIGEHEFDFEDAVRDEYAPAVAEDDARLLWYLHATHGAGEAYKIVTLTAVRDGAAWERLVERLRSGDLAGWRARVDALRYGSMSTLLVQTPWSPLGEIDLESVRATLGSEAEHDVAVLREDTLRGPGVAGSVVAPAGAGDGDVLRCVAAFTPVLDDGATLQVLYRLAARDRWTPAFGDDAGWDDWSGSLTAASPDGTRRTSRMLRTTTWSPLR